MASGTYAAEIGLMLYDGCQMCMVLGIGDLFATASQFSAERGGETLRISHWRQGPDGGMARCFDTHPDQAGEPAVIIVPGRLGALVGPKEAFPHS